MRAATCPTLVFCLSLLYAGNLFGGVEPAHSAYLSGKLFVPGTSNFVQNATFTNELGNFSAPTPPYIFVKKQQVRKIENMIELYLDPDFITFIDFSYLLEVKVELTKYEHNAVAPKTEIITLKINYHPKERTKWIEKANYHFTNCGRVEYKVLNIILTDNSNPNNLISLTTSQAQLVASVIKMRSDIIIERYFPFDPSTSPSGSLLSPKFDATKNELTISWLPILGAEFYDLEWTYVDDYDKSPTGSPISIPPGNLAFNKHFNLDRNSTRVRVTTTQYTFPMVFESGYILYRLRGTGMDYEPSTDKIYHMTGQWSTIHTPTPIQTVLTWPHKFTIPVPFENDKINWQIVTSYAEEGKNKSVITFMDGTYRNRQTITGLSTEREAMVAEQIYDHQGRPAIQVLPVPTNDPRLKYYKHFNLRLPGQPYNREHFDQTKFNIANGACDISADPMHTSSGASQYYSPQNPIKTNRHAYIPDASGYPFIQTEFTPDNTGRMSRQSGVGPDHRLGSRHETVYYYGTPVQEELSMLFGVEVGHADHYKKNVVQDPNYQLSVSFLDLKGKVIATALAGNPPKNLDPLLSYKPYPMDIDLMVFNKADSLANELVASRSFTVTTRSDYEFHYSMSRLAFEAALCKDIKLCYDCVYDLEIKVVDNYSCNTVLKQLVQKINPLQFDLNGDIAVNDACPKSPTSYNHSFTLKDLPVGSYTVTKKLKVNPAATEAYWAHYLNLFKDTCKVYEQLLAGYMSQVDSTLCELDDDEEPLNRCQIAKQGMLGDVSPDGQYGQVNWATYSSNDPLSVFNDQNRLPEPSAHWKNSSLVYKNEDGSNFQFKDAAGNPASHTALNLETFLEQWQPSFANTLLPFHPEYCYLQWCEQDMPSFDFDVELGLTPTYNEAKTKGYFDIANSKLLRAIDPYFNGIGGGTAGNPSWVSLMDQAINVYYQNTAQNIPAHSMLQVAVRTALQSANLPHTLSDANNWIATPTASLQDLVWRHFRALYLAKKEELQYRSRTFYAVNTCSNKGGYNGCIGAENFNWINTGVGSAVFSGPFNSTTSASACHWKTYHLYAEKAKRFPSVYDIPIDFDPYGNPNTVIQQFADWAGGMTGAYCGDTCVCNKAMMQFINWVIDGKRYFNPNVQPLPPGGFTPGLQKAIQKCHNRVVDSMIAQVLLNNTVRIELRENTTPVEFIFLEIPGGTMYHWETADSIDCIFYVGNDSTYVIAQSTLFTMNQGTFPFILKVRPNCPLWEKCADPGLACPPTEQAKHLSRLFNSLISQKKLNQTLQLDNQYISPGFAAYFSPISGAMPAITWSCQLSTGNTLQATLSGGSLNCRFTLDIPPAGFPLSNLGPVLSFKPDPAQTNPATGYTYHATMKVALLNGTGAVDIRVKSDCFPLSYCGKCPPGETRPRLTTAPKADQKGKKPGNKPVVVQPAPGNPSDLTVVAVHDPTRTCYPCDTLDYTLTYDSLTLSGSGLKAKYTSVMVHKKPPHDLCDPCVFDTLSLPTVPMPNPCIEEQILAAYANAANAYQQYLDSLRAAFRNGYVRHCMAAAETFTSKYTDDLHHFTLYYYDQAGNLLKTIPPDGVKPLNTTATKAAIAYMQTKTGTPVNPAHTMASDYTFNSLNQLHKQTIPDHDGPSEFFYDYLSRIVVSQNPEQYLQKRYSYTLYDKLNRPYETGEILNATTAMTPALAKNEPQLLAWIAAQTKREVTRTQYDKPLPGIAAQFFKGDERHYRDRIASVTYSELDGSKVTNATYYRYDIHGNVSHLVQDVYGLGPKKMEYDYDLISGNVKQVWYQKGEVDQYLHRYQYDADNRIITVRTSRDGKVWDVDTDYFYYRHGPLARTELGEHKVQGLDFAYTLHGWIKGVNSAALDENTDIGRDGRKYPQNLNIKIGSLTAKDAFGYTLRYYTGDYKAIAPAPLDWEPAYAGTAFHRPQRDLFNGNIQSMITAIGNPVNANTNFKPLGYAYSYDQLNRITAMRAYDGLNPISNNWNSVVSLQDYATAYFYDGNGNLQTLSRKGSAAAGSPIDMDDFKYHYYPGRNRLEYVNDAVPAGNYPEDIDDQLPGCYQYDAVGNLIMDNAENLGITWNVSGKVKAIQKSANSEVIKFHYDPTGKRVIQSVADNAAKKTDYTWYVLDATGNVMATYAYTETPLPVATIDHRLQSLYLYGSSRLGEERIDTTLSALKTMQNRQNDTWYSYRSRGAKYFELGNHLGNVLVTVSDRKLPYDLGNDKLVDGYDADMWTAQDYYPFGSGMPGRRFSEGGYRYGFGGQEKDNEVSGNGNSYTAEFWQYDPRIGRRWNVDLIILPWQSSYATFNNNPIVFIDPKGLQGERPEKNNYDEDGDGCSGPDEGCQMGDTNSFGFYYSTNTTTVRPSLSFIESVAFGTEVGMVTTFEFLYNLLPNVHTYGGSNEAGGHTGDENNRKFNPQAFFNLYIDLTMLQDILAAFSYMHQGNAQNDKKYGRQYNTDNQNRKNTSTKDDKVEGNSFSDIDKNNFNTDGSINPPGLTPLGYHISDYFLFEKYRDKYKLYHKHEIIDYNLIERYFIRHEGQWFEVDREAGRIIGKFNSSSQTVDMFEKK